MTTRGDWSLQFLKALGNDSPSASTINFVASWTLAENTRAAFNPLATTQPMPGSTCFNCPLANVQNYLTNGQGIEATVKTLTNGRYPHILEGLRTNEPEKAANGAELGLWGTGLHGVALWRLRDNRNGTLLTHGSGNAPPQSQQPKDGTPAPIEPEKGGRPIGVAMSDEDSTALAKAAQYIILGGLLIAISILLAVKTYVPVTQIVKAVV